MKTHFLSRRNHESLFNRNIYIYGAGEYAHNIKYALAEDKIPVMAFLVDDAYYNGVEGILPLSKYMRKYDRTDAVINGISNVRHFRKMMSEQTFQDIYVYFEPFLLWSYDEEYFNKHENDLKVVEDLYSDNRSVSVMKAFLEAKKTGQADRDIELASEEGTYFNTLTKEIPDGAYIDCGTFDGDSVEQFFKFIGGNQTNPRKVFAFEPDCDNFNILARRFKGNLNVHCVNKGVWDRWETLQFKSGDTMGSKISDSGTVNNITVEVTDIDSVVSSAKAAFIKMDVEGSELKALKGAEKTIRRDHPILAISAYHKPEDLFTLPQYIKTFDDETYKYDLYLLHHGVCAYELVLYAIPVRVS